MRIKITAKQEESFDKFIRHTHDLTVTLCSAVCKSGGCYGAGLVMVRFNTTIITGIAGDNYVVAAPTIAVVFVTYC